MKESNSKLGCKDYFFISVFVGFGLLFIVGFILSGGFDSSSSDYKATQSFYIRLTDMESFQREYNYSNDLNNAKQEQYKAELTKYPSDDNSEDFSSNSPSTSNNAIIGCPKGCTTHISGCDIKGNIKYESIEKIYHLPGMTYYDETTINPDYGERWFCTEAEAINNGFRKANDY